mmetsp:Transcript_21686/g.31133  ORF Transcript_21686/g.31133 Transcript_21686/m.31133 type:complete len:187 (+) Transcript_21686:50-610(+)
MTSYISIRDDSGVRSFSKNERDFLRDCALSSKKLRLDGRGANDVRRIQLHLSRSAHNGAECTVQWGETRVSSQIIGELIPPSPDRSSEGVISISVDLSPMASSLFGMAPPVTTTPGEDRGGHFSSTSEEEQKLLSNRITKNQNFRPRRQSLRCHRFSRNGRTTPLSKTPGGCDRGWTTPTPPFRFT